MTWGAETITTRAVYRMNTGKQCHRKGQGGGITLPRWMFPSLRQAGGHEDVGARKRWAVSRAFSVDSPGVIDVGVHRRIMDLTRPFGAPDANDDAANDGKQQQNGTSDHANQLAE